jgi:acyl-CoA synthetase (AMP-forming)/AMP-acid ligase II
MSSSVPEQRLNDAPTALTETAAETVFEAFEHTARRFPSHEFLLVPESASRHYADGALSYTYAAANADVQVLRAAYQRAGLGPGMRVATLLENRPAAFLHWFALNGLGVSVVPINPDYRAAELAYLLEHSEARLAVVLPERLADVRSAAATAARPPRVVEASTVSHGFDPLGPMLSPLEPARAHECAVLYTSGTTGRPKGCLLSNDYFLRLGLRYLHRKGYISLRPERERVLTPLPMFHMNAMATTTLAMVLSAGCIIQLDRFHPRTWWEDVVSTRATGIHYLGVMPAILLALSQAPNERAHAVRYGTGANVEPKHHAPFEARFGFPLIEAWAMTETGSAIGVGAEEEPRHVGTRCFGRVPATAELRLVDDAGNDVVPGQPGEMLVRRAGANPRLGFFSGYLKDEKATEEGWANGWWHTGDMARAGSDGCLYFVDRKKNVIRRSGENISALEVEEILRSCPDVRDVAVTAAPDEMRGDEVLACIVAAPGAESNAAAAGRIVQWMLRHAAYYKAPGWVAFVAAVPTTATQKVDRAGLKQVATALLEDGSCFDTRALKRRGEPALS